MFVEKSKLLVSQKYKDLKFSSNMIFQIPLLQNLQFSRSNLPFCVWKLEKCTRKAEGKLSVEFESPGGVWGVGPTAISRTKMAPEDIVCTHSSLSLLSSSSVQK